jgi:hypothetical protein
MQEGHVAVVDWWRKQIARYRDNRQKRRDYALGVEAVVDRVDPRLRGLAGYRTRLTPALEKGVASADALVASLPAPLLVSRDGWAANRRLRAYFANPGQMQEVLGGNRMLRDFLTGAAAANVTEVYAAMSMRMDRRTRFGSELDGDRLLSDQRQETISFSDFRIGAVAGDEAAFRKALRRRVLEEVAARAMQRIMGMRTRRDMMSEEKTRLQWKLKMYEMREAGVGTLWHDSAAYRRHMEGLRSELGTVSTGLDDLVAQAGDLADFLEIVALEFEQIDQAVRLESTTLCLTDMNVESSPERGGKVLELTALRVGKRRPRIVELIRFPPHEISVDPDRALRRAARALGVH